MNRRMMLAFTTGLVVLLILAGCGAPPQPPVPVTPIPSLIPATLPPQPTVTVQPVALGVTFPSRHPSAKTARTLYQQHCVNCHGPKGTGIVPGARDFSDADYLRGQTPVRFFRIISEGRGGMPAWKDKLSVDERWDLTFYIWQFAVPREVLEEGKTLYEKNCAPCHGIDGRGVVPGTPDFTDIEWMASRAPRDLFKVVTEGKNAMPSWQGRLSPEERWAAIEYLRTFAYEPPSASKTAALPSR